MLKIELEMSKEEVQRGQPQTLKSIVNFLIQNEIKIKCFFEINSSQVILIYSNLQAKFRNSSEACNYLYDIYLNLLQKQEEELLKNKIIKDFQP